MADQAVHPSSKPNPGKKPAKTSLPTTKSQIIGGASKPSSSARRGFCRSCSLCFATLLALLILLAAISVGIFYAVYRPHRTVFSVASLRVAVLNVSAARQLAASRINVNVTASNHNKKLVFFYDPIYVSVVLATGSGGVNVGDGSYPGFILEVRITTVLSTVADSSVRQLDATATEDLKKSSNLVVKVAHQGRDQDREAED